MIEINPHSMRDKRDQSSIPLNKAETSNLISGAGIVKLAKLLKQRNIEEILVSDLEEMGRMIVQKTIKDAKQKLKWYHKRRIDQQK